MSTGEQSAVDIVFDVDGVFNAFPPMHYRVRRDSLALDWGWDCEPVEVAVIGFPITYSTALVERVNSLVARADVTPYWLTTWCDRAPLDLCPSIGLQGDQWPVLGVQEHRAHRGGRWKLAAIRKHLAATDNRVVWIDDDLADEREARAWVSSVNTETQGRLLGLAPETHNGLTLAHLDLIEQWVTTGSLATRTTS